MTSHYGSTKFGDTRSLYTKLIRTPMPEVPRARPRAGGKIEVEVVILKKETTQKSGRFSREIMRYT
jgi:hypothetical protein